MSATVSVTTIHTWNILVSETNRKYHVKCWPHDLQMSADVQRSADVRSKDTIEFPQEMPRSFLQRKFISHKKVRIMNVHFVVYYVKKV